LLGTAGATAGEERRASHVVWCRYVVRVYTDSYTETTMEKTQQVKTAKKSDAAFETMYPTSKKNRFSVGGGWRVGYI
jgi:hypothetical protein